MERWTFCHYSEGEPEEAQLTILELCNGVYTLEVKRRNRVVVPRHVISQATADECRTKYEFVKVES